MACKVKISSDRPIAFLFVCFAQTRTIIRGFHKRTKLAILTLLSTSYYIQVIICSFLLYLQHIMLVNMKIDIIGCNMITFQCCILHWSSSILMAQLKWSWQYWHSCIAERLWKPITRKHAIKSRSVKNAKWNGKKLECDHEICQWSCVSLWSLVLW